MTILRNVELCNEGKCMRVRMGDERHEKHGFTNNYLKKLEKIRTGVTIVFILLMSLIVFFHIGPDLGLDDNDKWTITIAIFAALASILIAVTNLTIKNKQLQTSSLFKVFELLASPDIRKSRKIIHDKYHDFKSEQKKFSETEVEKDADVVLYSLDQVSATVLNGLLDKDLFFDTYGEMIVREWKTFKDEIAYRQSKNKKTLRHFTALKNDFEEILRKDPEYKDSDTDPY